MPVLFGKRLNILRWIPQLPGVGAWFMRMQLGSLAFTYQQVALFDVQELAPTMFPNDTFKALLGGGGGSGSGGEDDSTSSSPPPSTYPGFQHAGFAAYMAAYKGGTLTPLDVAKRYIHCVDESNHGPDALHAIIALNATDLLTQAEASTERHRTGHVLSPFDGIPIVVKDEIDVQGYRTCVGTAFLGRHHVAQKDAVVVQRLRAKGFIIAGKANMMEIGIQPYGFNKHWGHVLNPFDTQCDSGGSSSGSACAVSAGLVPAALGCDGGGSIRIPSAFCGVVGLKANHGRISESGVFPLCFSVGHCGPIATNVEDTRALYSIIAGPAEGDIHTQGIPVLPSRHPRTHNSLQGWKIGVCQDWVDTASSKAVLTNFEASLKVLTGLGATVVPFKIPCFDQMRLAHTSTIISEMCASMRSHRGEWHKMMAVVNFGLTVSEHVDGAFYVTAQKVRTFACTYFHELFNERGVDAIVTPSTGCLAPRFHIPGRDMSEGISDAQTLFDTMLFAFLSNFIGNPAISVPNGYCSLSGLPTGFQVMSRPFAEEDALFLAQVLEKSVKRAKPKVYFNVLNKGD